MRKIKTLLRSLWLALVAFILISPAIALATPGDVSTWTTSGNSLPANRSLSVNTTYNGFVYVIGGWTGSAGSTTVYYAPLNANGSVGTWVTNGTSLPVALRASFGLAYNGYMYVMGGLNNSNARLSTIYYAPINVDGSLGSWTTNSTALPQTLQESMTIARDGYLYIFGGYSGSVLTTVRYAPINVDGSIGSWTTDTALPAARSATTAVLQNDKVYLVGGLDSGVASMTSVVYADFDADHSMGMWTTGTSLPDARNTAGVVASDGYIYVTGGAKLGSVQNTVYSTKVKSDGTLGSWTSSANLISPATSGHASVAHNNFVYVIGGENVFASILSQVAYATLTPPIRTVSATNPVTSKPAVISTDWGTDITCSSTTAESSLGHQDSSYSYPVGLVSFCFDTDAASNEVTVTFVTDLAPSQVTARHYNVSSGTYTTIPGAVITATTYNSEAALRVTYTITDNGSLDSNSATGSVSDPVGLALSITAPDTGFAHKSTVPIVAFMIVGALFIAIGVYGQKRAR